MGGPDAPVGLVKEGVFALHTKSSFSEDEVVDVAPRAHSPVTQRSALRTFRLLLIRPRPSGFNSHTGALECSVTPERPRWSPAWKIWFVWM